MSLTFFGWLSHTIRLRFLNAFHSPNPDDIATFGLASFAFARRYSQNLV